MFFYNRLLNNSTFQFYTVLNRFYHCKFLIKNIQPFSKIFFFLCVIKFLLFLVLVIYFFQLAHVFFFFLFQLFQYFFSSPSVKSAMFTGFCSKLKIFSLFLWTDGSLPSCSFFFCLSTF